MTSKYKFSVLSILLIMAMLCSFVILPVSAAEEAEALAKIDSGLIEKMETVMSDEKIPVAIWYTDINQDSVDELTVNKVGYSKDDIDLAYSMPSSELIDDLKNGEAEAVSEMQAYLRQTEAKRETERQKTNEYIMTRRAFSRQKYNEKSEKVVRDIAVNEKDIIFKSQYAPMIIVSLSAPQVSSLSKDENIKEMYYAAETEIESAFSDSNYDKRSSVTRAANEIDPNMDIIQRSIRQRKVTDELNLSGNGVNIGVVEAGGKAKSGYALDYSKISNIGVNTSDSGHLSSVAEIIAGTTKGFARGTNRLLCTNTDYQNIEALLSNTTYPVNLINMSHASSNGTVFYAGLDKWIDHVVSQHGVTVVVAADNKGETSGQISSPGRANNVITVGAYHPGVDYQSFTLTLNDDTMAASSSYNNEDCVEKPDVVMPGGSTSHATPMLTGCIALMFELKPSLANKPQAVKAIVLASCHRKVLPATGTPAESIFDGITDRQGAGAPDVWNMASIVCQGTYGIGILRGSTNSHTIHFVQPIGEAASMNVSLTWLRSNYYPVTDNGHLGYDDLTVGTSFDLDLIVDLGYRDFTSALVNSSTEMVYFNLLTGDKDYEMTILRPINYAGDIRYGYAYSLDDTYVSPVTYESIYYLKNYSTNKYLTLNTSTGDTYLSNFSGGDNQKWIVREKSNKYELLPAYGSIAGKLNAGSLYNTNSYYAELGQGNMNMVLADEDDLNSIKTGAVSFYTTKNNTHYFLTASGTEALFSYASLDSISTTRMWNLEKINYRRGDVDMNGVLENADLTLLINHVSNGRALNNQQLFLADVNYDGYVNSGDVTRVQNILNGIVNY